VESAHGSLEFVLHNSSVKRNLASGLGRRPRLRCGLAGTVGALPKRPEDPAQPVASAFQTDPKVLPARLGLPNSLRMRYNPRRGHVRGMSSVRGLNEAPMPRSRQQRRPLPTLAPQCSRQHAAAASSMLIGLSEKPVPRGSSPFISLKQLGFGSTRARVEKDPSSSSL
jgi:hypothetical protein